jgi:hypothetical protein
VHEHRGLRCVAVVHFVSRVGGEAGQASRQLAAGGYHDQGDAEWIVTRGQLRGHNDMPFGRPTPGQPVGRPRADPPFRSVFSHY